MPVATPLLIFKWCLQWVCTALHCYKIQKMKHFDYIGFIWSLHSWANEVETFIFSYQSWNNWCCFVPLQEQYKFIYEAIEEYLICGHSYFPVSELSKVLKRKSMKGENGKNEYQLEFEVRTPKYVRLQSLLSLTPIIYLFTLLRLHHSK